MKKHLSAFPGADPPAIVAGILRTVAATGEATKAARKTEKKTKRERERENANHSDDFSNLRFPMQTPPPASLPIGLCVSHSRHPEELPEKPFITRAMPRTGRRRESWMGKRQESRKRGREA